MMPVVFDGCFGWFHPGLGERGVVLCAAFGHENMVAYRGWRCLAESLASRNFHVLRFDYSGTGDSIGEEDDPNRLDAWRCSVVSAVRHLETVSGANEIILVGLRFGATLALLASAELDSVRGVACLAPVLTGKSYVRELRLRASSWREANLHTVDRQPCNHLDVLGDRLAAQTIGDLLQTDVTWLERPPGHVLFMGAVNGPIALAASNRLQSLGCQSTVEDFPGVADFLEDSISSKIPYEAFARVVDWCGRSLPERNRPANWQAKSMALDRPITLTDMVMVEKSVSFGSSRHLFGILCQPKATVRGVSPVIMLNTGFGRRIGDGRVFTILARRLAAVGIPSLRMDLAGFGDSEAVAGDDAKPYDAGTSADVRSAVDLLEQAGYRSPHVVGICSGAFAAFRAASLDPRICGLVMVNIQTFNWKPGLSLRVVNKRQRRPVGFYLHAVVKRSAWRRLRRGEIAVGNILLALCRRSLAVAGSRFMDLLERSLGWQTLAGQVRRWFHDLALRKVQVSLFYSQNDPGLTELALHFGRGGKHLRRYRNVELHQMVNADHALFDRTSRLTFVEMVVDLMRRRTSNSDAMPDASHPASPTIMS